MVNQRESRYKLIYIKKHLDRESFPVNAITQRINNGITSDFDSYCIDCCPLFHRVSIKIIEDS